MNDYTLEDFERFVRDSNVPAHCGRCGEHVTDAEPDFDGYDMDCPHCGAEGKHIQSILVMEGLI